MTDKATIFAADGIDVFYGSSQILFGLSITVTEGQTMALLLTLLATPVAAQSQEAAFSQLLQSSPWCTFRYNKITGYSNSTRYRFYENGSYAVGSQGEGYSSGAGGTFSSQNNSGNSGRWAVRDGLFLMSKGQGEMGTVTVSVRNNSNGAPIIVADGVEYSQCR